MQSDEAFIEWLLSPEGGDCIKIKLFDDGFYAAIGRLMFHYTMIVGQVGDRISYTTRYCYQTQEGAEKAMEAWDGIADPDGWHRHPDTGRRRPDGDVSREYVAW